MEIDFNKIAKINLRDGAGGGNPQDGLCIMEMVSYFDGADRVTDRPDCACPVLTNIAIAINDRAPSQEDRDTLKPLLPLLAGSLDPERRQARAWFVMRETNVRIFAVRLDKVGRGDLADALRAAPDAPSLRLAVNAARDAMRVMFKKKFSNAYASAYASAYADAHASAYADAHASAYAYAYASAYTSAYTYANAYANAYASAYASAYADAHASAYAYASADARMADRKQVFAIMRDILTEALKMGNHGALDPAVFERRVVDLSGVLGRDLAGAVLYD